MGIVLALPTAAPAVASEGVFPVSPAANEVWRLEQATADLARAKRAAVDTVARLRRERADVLSSCTKGGRGWKRIRAVRQASQRALYVRAARVLLKDMATLLLEEQTVIAAYADPFERFMSNVGSAAVNSPLLKEAVAAHARRRAYYGALEQIKVGCRVFNKLTVRVREFPTRTPAQIIRADYRASPIARRIERYVSSRVRIAQRRSGVSDRDAHTLEQAAAAMVGLGGNPGYANGFRYALSLR